MARANGPHAGNPLNMDDLEMILEAISARQQNFPNEPAALAFVLVMQNIGDRFTPITCSGGEWEGVKSDIPGGEGAPTCPNGHELIKGNRLKIGWLEETE